MGRTDEVGREDYSGIPKERLPSDWQKNAVVSKDFYEYPVSRQEFMDSLPVPENYNVLQEEKSTFDLLNEDQSELLEKIHQELSKEGCC
jgi:hypothetical protein